MGRYFVINKAPKKLGIENRKFVCLFYWQSLTEISLGVSLDLRSPNIEIHLPFSFIKIGWEGINIYKDNFKNN